MARSRHRVPTRRHGGEPAAAAGSGRRRTTSNSTAWNEGASSHANMDTTLLAVSLLALGLYLNTLPAEFAYDDSRAILKNPDLSSDVPLHQLFFNDFWGTPLTHSGSHKSYRPLCVLTFRLNHALDGLRPLGYHLVNVLLHAAASALFLHVCRAVTRDRPTAAAAGLLFAAHPVHTEAVAGVVGRADVLACCFFLLALLSYARYCRLRDSTPSHVDCANFTKTKEARSDGRSNDGRSNDGRLNDSRSNDVRTSGLEGLVESCLESRWTALLGAGLATAAAMLSKEQGVTVLAVCALYDVFIHSGLGVRDLPGLLSAKYHAVQEGLLSLSALAFLLIGSRVYHMGNKPPEFAPADNPASDSSSLLTRTLTFHYLPFLNLWLLLYPRVLSFDWSMEAVPLIETFTDLRNLCTLMFYSVLAYMGIYLMRNLGKASPLPPSHSPQHQVHCTNLQTPQNGDHHPGNGFPYRNGNSRLRARRGSDASSTDSCHSDDLLVTLQRPLSSPKVLLLSLALLIFPFIPATNLFFYVGFVLAERVLYVPSMGFCLLVAYGATRLGGGGQRALGLKKAALGLLLVAYSCRTVLRNQDWQSEENLYRAGISVNPAKAWGNLANILNSKGQAAAAEEAYRAALLQRGNMADVHYNLGILLQEQKRYSEAVESYKMAIQCRPRLTMAHLNLGIVYTSLGRKDEAEEIYRHCSSIDISGLKDPRLHEQTKISALYNLGRLLADQERYHEAVAAYQDAIARRPPHYAPQSLYNMLGEAYSKLDDLTEAERWYGEALRAKPDHIPAHLTMAKLLHRKGHLAGAEEWFVKARLIDPKDGSVHQHFGQFLGEVGRHRDAADHYVRAAALAPDDFELVFNAANALRQAGRDPEAEEYYRRAARLSPHTATAHMNLGAMLHYNGKLEEAERSYLTALSLRPDDAVTLANLNKLRNLRAGRKMP